MNDLLQIISKFLKKNHDPEKSLLLALSGGPDSLALFYALIEYRKNFPLDFAIAHIDHGWREESAKEAEHLKQIAHKYQLKFHLKKLDPKLIEGNLELECRKARLKFFAEICKEHSYQAVLAGHHQNDQSETILKRILEGESLPYLSGIKEINTLYDVTIWRPFLNVQKNEILEWLNNRDVLAFEDSTNIDIKYLRGRFRSNIIPYLDKEFGKEVNKSLYRLGQEALELKNFLDNYIKPYLNSINRSDWGILIDLNQKMPIDIYALKYLLRHLCEEQNIVFSHHLINLSAQLILSNAANKQIIKKDHKLIIDRKRIFFLNKRIDSLPKDQMVLEDNIVFGKWKVNVQEEEVHKKIIQNQWQYAWNGKIEAILPLKKYWIGSPQLNIGYPRNTPLGKWWNNEKIPAFMRHHVPVIWNENGIQHEFLTGKIKCIDSENEISWIKVCLERI